MGRAGQNHHHREREREKNMLCLGISSGEPPQPEWEIACNPGKYKGQMERVSTYQMLCGNVYQEKLEIVLRYWLTEVWDQIKDEALTHSFSIFGVPLSAEQGQLLSLAGWSPVEAPPPLLRLYPALSRCSGYCAFLWTVPCFSKCHSRCLSPSTSQHQHSA